MIFVLLGVALGIGISVGPLSSVAGPVDAAGSAITEAAGAGATNLLEALGANSDGTWVIAVSTLIAVMVPGLVSLALVYIALSISAARRAVSVLLVIAALCAFAVLEPFAATGLVAAALALVALAWLATGPIVQIPLATVATVLAVRTVDAIWSDNDNWLSDAAATLTDAAGTGAASTSLWHIALSFAAGAPRFGAAWMLIGWGDRSDDRSDDRRHRNS